MNIPLTLDIGRLGGTSFRVHLSLAALIGWFALHHAMGDWGVVFEGAALGAALAFHELAHLLSARACGVPVQDVVLYPFGSLSKSGGAAPPARRIAIALAGPALNLALAAVGAVIFFSGRIGGESAALGLQSFALANAVLGIVNLLPVYPLDGAQIYRAAADLMPERGLARFEDRAALGAALGLTALAAVSGDALLLAVAAFAIWGVFRSTATTKGRELCGGGPIESVMTELRELAPLRHGAPLAGVVSAVLKSHQFVFPIVLEEQILGVAFRDDIIDAASHGEDLYIGELIDRGLTLARCEEDVSSVFERIRNGGTDPVLVVREGEPVGIVFRQQIAELMCVNIGRKGADRPAPAAE